MKIPTSLLKVLFILVFVLGFAKSPQARGMSQIWTPAPVQIVDRSYDYYPDQQVFYDSVDRIYYFLDGQIWKSGYRGVPDWITLGRKVSVNIVAPKPYYKFAEIKAQYPPKAKI